jgi:hypothetical protein
MELAMESTVEINVEPDKKRARVGGACLSMLYGACVVLCCVLCCVVLCCVILFCFVLCLSCFCVALR